MGFFSWEGDSYVTNQPAQPSYGEGMAEAMAAQMQQLLGTGTFGEIYEEAGLGEAANLGTVLRDVEAPLRRQTAQIDTDVLRQTLLGDAQTARTITEADVKAGAHPSSLGQVGLPQLTHAYTAGSGNLTGGALGAHNKYKWVKEAVEKVKKDGSAATYDAAFKAKADRLGISDDEYKAVMFRTALGEDPTGPFATKLAEFSEEIRDAGGSVEKKQTFVTTHPQTGQPLKEGETVRAETGMLDLFGPKEAGAVTREIGSDDDRYEQYMRSNMTADPAAAEYFELAKARDPSVTPEAQAAAAQGLAAFGRFHHAEAAAVEGAPRPLPEIGDPMTTATGELLSQGRRAGFDPVTGEFLGLTTLGADVSEQLARRQRTADIADVQRLGPMATDAYRQQGVQYDPATGEAIAGTGISGALSAARALGPGGAGAPSAQVGAGGVLGGTDADTVRDMYIRTLGREPDAAGLAGWTKELSEGRVTPESLQGIFLQARAGGDAAPMMEGRLQSQARRLGADPLTITGETLGAPTEYAELDQVTGGRIGGEYDPTGGTDPLRKQLISEAQKGLGEGLTARELRNIQEGTRAAATARGRVRDIGSVQTEVEARLLEDRQRQAMNRAFAQQALGAEAGYQQADLGRGLQAQLANVGAEQQRRQFGVQAGLGAAEFEAQQRAQAQLANLQTQQAGIGRELGAAESDVERAMRLKAMEEQYRQAGLGQERAAAAQMVGLEQATGADPFQAILGRPSGAGAAMGQQMFGRAGYGLDSGPQYLNPESGLGYISQAAANEARMWGAWQMAQAGKQSGLMGALGSIGGGVLQGMATGRTGLFKCWVAREVYGAHNPAWLLFRNWLDTDAPRWFDKLYLTFGERFAKFISDKPRLKARIRGWMDTKIGRV